MKMFNKTVLKQNGIEWLRVIGVIQEHCSLLVLSKRENNIHEK